MYSYRLLIKEGRSELQAVPPQFLGSGFIEMSPPTSHLDPHPSPCSPQGDGIISNNWIIMSRLPRAKYKEVRVFAFYFHFSFFFFWPHCMA